MSKKKKEKKEKVVYYDDGSTIADMSNVTKIGQRKPKQPPLKKRSTFWEKWRTYWSSVKMMILPLLVVLTVMAVLYLVMRFSCTG